MELSEVINNRRSVRLFSDKNVPDNIIKKIIHSAIQAPSACNVKGWRFIIIKDKKTKQKIVNAKAASFILGAPIGILVAYDNRTDNIEYKDHIQSASASIQNMILTASSLGIGTCWVCHLPLKKKLRKILRIPDSYDPIAYIPIGYPKNKLKIIPRIQSVESVISYDKFDFKVPYISPTQLLIKKTLRKIYLMLPFSKHLKPVVDKLFEKKFD